MSNNNLNNLAKKLEGIHIGSPKAEKTMEEHAKEFVEKHTKSVKPSSTLKFGPGPMTSKAATRKRSSYYKEDRTSRGRNMKKRMGVKERTLPCNVLTHL